ncbi:E3 ubiquitin-protein ligase TRIM7 [Xenopus laevis]|uniref:E3 ubiquitin-protein ligase TRIM7 n=1 Tax=Xenopus laevis TaxID=8355 RepID=A0A8J0U876_XENLA|nr:E3 ubiquitin-protein ligase TRIM7 [Xenopus laevis]OCT57520.1 hypothetical protein XELAEV_18003398mg [Xenopus laevis]
MLAVLREELSCSICLNIYTDPVLLPCGHNFCRGCIEKVLGAQEGSGAYSCPECRQESEERPTLPRNRTLGNIAEKFLTIHPKPREHGILCTYCIHSFAPAAKSCLLCEASICEAHVKVHSKSEGHILTEATVSFRNTKCSIHKELLKYYCCEDGAPICVSCCLVGEHRGHRVELLSEASEKKKEKLRKVVEKLRPEREETERGAQRLQERRREVAEKAAGETERVTALFRDIREQLEALEKQLLSDISREQEKLSLTLTDLMEQLEIKKEELTWKIHHIEELCNMADPLIVLQEWASDGAEFCGAVNDSNEGEERDKSEVPVVGLISETFLTGLAGIVTGAKGRIYGQEATDLVLDINTAGSSVLVSGDKKTVSCTEKKQCRPQTPERFEECQVLSSRSFQSGRHYWEVEGSECGYWLVGAAYPSIERGGCQSVIGNNGKSWCMYRWSNYYLVRHQGKETKLSQDPSCKRLGISLDYEAGRLSFYELSEPIRHLHTFIAQFTEPLHAAFSVWREDGWVRIIS